MRQGLDKEMEEVVRKRGRGSVQVFGERDEGIERDSVSL